MTYSDDVQYRWGQVKTVYNAVRDAVCNVYKKFRGKVSQVTHRIVEVDGKFIPQHLASMGYEGIERESFSAKHRGYDTWRTWEFQLQYCGHDTLEEARATLDYYKSKNKPVKVRVVE